MRFAFLSECWKRLILSKTPPTITRRVIYMIGRPTAYSTQKARTQLGWKPKMGIREGIQQALEWFVSLPQNKHIKIKTPVLADVKAN